MKIVEVKPIEGANIYTHRPVVKLKLDLGDHAETATDNIPGFADRLMYYIPSLKDHYCSRGRAGGFVERMKEGTYLGHVIEHVALELQHLAGMDVVYGKTVRAEEAGNYYIITEYESKEGGIQALRSAVKTVTSILEKTEIDINSEITLIRTVAARYGLGPSTGAIAQEAVKRGIPVMRLGEGSILQLGYGKYLQKVEATITGQTKCIGVDIACDKVLVKQLLSESGIPVPGGGVARTEKEAMEIANQIGEAVVVKPYDGNQGQGVALNLKSKKEIKKSLEMALSISPKAIVEKFIQGGQYRLTVVDERLVAASERIPAFVVGNGQQTIRELVNVVNSDPLRGEEHEKPLTKIKIDPIVIMVLAKRGLTPDSVPAPDEIVYLRENANLSTGGVAVDVTGIVHPDTVQMVVRAVRLVGLDVAGVDLVVQDIRKPLTADNGAIIEVNAAPGIRMHHYPAKGKPRNVAGAIVEMLFPQGSKSRIPIVSVTGTNGKTTVTRLVSHILQGTGITVGMTTTEGIYVNKTKIVDGDTTGPLSAKVVLREPSVEAAVFETARGGILRAGLGYDYSNVGIITNISNDHLGMDGIETIEDMTYVKSVVAEAVYKDGYTVLNADDVNAVSISENIRSSVIYFSAASDNIIVRRHLGIGGIAVFVKNGSVVVACGTKIQKILPVKHIPCTMGGLALHNVQNALAAVAGCRALGIDPEFVREGLLSFKADEYSNPGRLNVFDLGMYRVVVDYGHNEAGFVNTLHTVKRMKPKRIIGVIGVPGDRINKDIIQAGKIAASCCDFVIIKEDSDLRGRKPGETAELIFNGLLESGMGQEKVLIEPLELNALKSAIGLAQKGDVIVIFYEKLEPVLEYLHDLREALLERDTTGAADREIVC